MKGKGTHGSPGTQRTEDTGCWRQGSPGTKYRHERQRHHLCNYVTVMGKTVAAYFAKRDVVGLVWFGGERSNLGGITHAPPALSGR